MYTNRDVLIYISFSRLTLVVKALNSYSITRQNRAISV